MRKILISLALAASVSTSHAALSQTNTHEREFYAMAYVGVINAASKICGFETNDRLLAAGTFFYRRDKRSFEITFRTGAESFVQTAESTGYAIACASIMQRFERYIRYED